MRLSTVRLFLLLTVLVSVFAGCGNLYWQRQGGTVQDFERDSLPCVEEGRTAKYGVGAEDLYHGCMKSQGWQRVQAPVPDVNQFRGPEETQDIIGPPPSPFGGPRYGAFGANRPAEITEAESTVLCQRPIAMRPAGTVCQAAN